MTSTLFQGKTLLITGGTGTFGNAVVDMASKAGFGEIRIFSRDEKKQDDMRNRLKKRRGEVLPGRCAELRQRSAGDARRGFRVPCGGAETGSVMRVLSD